MRRLPKQQNFEWRDVGVRAPHGFGGWRTVLTTALLAVILMSAPLALGGVRWWGEFPLLGAVAALLVLQSVRLLKPAPDTESRRADVIDLTVALFVLYTLLRWLVAPATFSLVEMLDVIAYAGIFFTCRYGMINRRCCIALLFGLIGLGLVETMFGFYLSHFSDPTDPATQWFPFGAAERAHVDFFPRWVGTYGSPNHYAALLVMAITAALAIGSFSKLSWLLRILLVYTAIAMMTGLMYSGSRGAWLALAAAVIALVVVGIRNGTVRWWIPVGAAVAFLTVEAGLFSLSPFVRERMTQDGIAAESGITQPAHASFAQVEIALAQRHPFFGAGPGTFAFLPPQNSNRVAVWEGVLLKDDYLNCVDDYGLVGFGLVMFFAAMVTLKFFQPLGVNNRWQDRTLVAAGFAVWIAVLIHSAVDYNLHIPANALLFFAITGLALGRFRQDRGIDLGLRRVSRWRPRLGWALIAGCVIYGIGVVQAARMIAADENSSSHLDRLSQNFPAPLTTDPLVRER